MSAARVAALRILAQRRVTEVQLWARLERRGYAEDQIREAVECCKRNGYLDDRLFAELFIVQKRKALGDRRLVGELVKRGIDRNIAADAVQKASAGESARIELAIAKIFRAKPAISYPSAARALERLGFPASLIYHKLRELAAHCHPELGGMEAPPMP